MTESKSDEGECISDFLKGFDAVDSWSDKDKETSSQNVKVKSRRRSFRERKSSKDKKNSNRVEKHYFRRKPTAGEIDEFVESLREVHNSTTISSKNTKGIENLIETSKSTETFGSNDSAHSSQIKKRRNDSGSRLSDVSNASSNFDYDKSINSSTNKTTKESRDVSYFAGSLKKTIHLSKSRSLSEDTVQKEAKSQPERVVIISDDYEDSKINFTEVIEDNKRKYSREREKSSDLRLTLHKKKETSYDDSYSNQMKYCSKEDNSRSRSRNSKRHSRHKSPKIEKEVKRSRQSTSSLKLGSRSNKKSTNPPIASHSPKQKQSFLEEIMNKLGPEAVSTYPHLALIHQGPDTHSSRNYSRKNKPYKNSPMPSTLHRHFAKMNSGYREIEGGTYSEELMHPSHQHWKNFPVIQNNFMTGEKATMSSELLACRQNFQQLPNNLPENVFNTGEGSCGDIGQGRGLNQKPREQYQFIPSQFHSHDACSENLMNKQTFDKSYQSSHNFSQSYSRLCDNIHGSGLYRKTTNNQNDESEINYEVPSAPPPPVLTSLTKIEKTDHKENMGLQERENLSVMLQDKSVSLSCLLEAAISSGKEKRPRTLHFKKEIVERCEMKITKLYRRRNAYKGCFLPDFTQMDYSNRSPLSIWNTSVILDKKITEPRVKVLYCPILNSRQISIDFRNLPPSTSFPELAYSKKNKPGKLLDSKAESNFEVTTCYGNQTQPNYIIENEAPYGINFTTSFSLNYQNVRQFIPGEDVTYAQEPLNPNPYYFKNQRLGEFEIPGPNLLFFENKDRSKLEGTKKNRKPKRNPNIVHLSTKKQSNSNENKTVSKIDKITLEREGFKTASVLLIKLRSIITEVQKNDPNIKIVKSQVLDGYLTSVFAVSKDILCSKYDGHVSVIISPTVLQEVNEILNDLSQLHLKSRQMGSLIKKYFCSTTDIVSKLKHFTQGKTLFNQEILVDPSHDPLFRYLQNREIEVAHKNKTNNMSSKNISTKSSLQPKPSNQSVSNEMEEIKGHEVYSKLGDTVVKMNDKEEFLLDKAIDNQYNDDVETTDSMIDFCKRNKILNKARKSRLYETECKEVLNQDLEEESFEKEKGLEKALDEMSERENVKQNSETSSKKEVVHWKNTQDDENKQANPKASAIGQFGKILKDEVVKSQLQDSKTICLIESLKKEHKGNDLYALKGGVLCQKYTVSGVDKWKMILPSSSVKEIVNIVHTISDPHASPGRIYLTLEKYFSPIENVEAIVSECLQKCLKCKR